MQDGTELRVLIKESGNPVWLIGLHGIGEHLERHSYLHDLFTNDFNILQFDLRGHGRSMGEKGYIDDFSLYMKDLREIIAQMKANYRMERFTLYGHSMGALIVADFMQNLVQKDSYPEVVFLSAPPVGFTGPLGVMIKASPLWVVQKLAGIKKSVRLSGLVETGKLSHNPSVHDEYINDELNCIKLHSKLLLELVKTSKEVFSRPIGIRCPAYCAVGEGDKIVDVTSLKTFFTQVEKTTCVKVIPDAFHEMHNEIEKYQKSYFDFLKNNLTQRS